MIQNVEAEKLLELGRIGMEPEVVEMQRLEGQMERGDIKTVGWVQVEYSEYPKGYDRSSSHQVAS